jgi:hypothetical protein
MTTTPQVPGWYPSPSGTGQGYWDGQQWSAGPPPAAQIDPNALRQAMAENRSIWVTNGLAAWSLVISFAAFVANFAFGAGAFIGGLGLIVAYVAFNKSKKTGQGRGMALTGLALNGADVVFGVIVWLVLMAAS